MSKLFLASGLTAALVSAQPVWAEVYFESSGKISAEARFFTEDAQFSGQQENTNVSFTVEPEFYWEFGNGDNSITFAPYLRIDENDDERTHGDIRELSWLHLSDDWELRAGLRKVFWGVTEFQHLADVINQTDAVDNFDGEDKLGQPMINLSLVKDWGIVDLFVLPGFRERTFAGQAGRFRAGLLVNTDAAEYESDDEERHIDTAIRWSHTLGDFDLGAYWFHGTNRDPLLVARNINGTTMLVPRYLQMDQLGVDVQATLGDWLWKGESIWRSTSAEDYVAAQAGFEYTLYGILDSSADLGLLAEYGWDERGKQASATGQNDLYLGTRYVLNDEASTEMLMGVSYDMDYDSKSLLVEASRRYGENWILRVDASMFSMASEDQTSAFDRDDYVQLTAEMYF
ncbi:MAG: hypothetical protein ACPGPF_00200 [Pontibacterium sp.]